ncbi:MAG: hypothetical protein JKY12_01090 [Sneathiella sp.]|nr:hypothetical protein [Sneathiella sp.]
MINSQNNIYKSCLGFWMLLGVFMGSFQAAAQEKPRSLVPTFGGTLPSATQKLDKREVDVFAPNGGVQAENQQGSGNNALVVETLDALSPASTGLLSNDSGGFGAQMWSGTASNLTYTLLQSIPAKTKSPQLLDLTRRLLLTGALLPQSKDDASKHLDLRFKKLRNAGLTIDAAELFRRLQFDATTDTLRKMSAQMSLLLNQNEAACELATNPLGQTDRDVFWRKLDVFCRVLVNEYDKAELGVALLEELGEKDPAFYTIFAKLVGDTEPAHVDMIGLMPLHIAMMRKAEISFDLSSANTLSLEILEAVIATPELLGVGGLDAAFTATEYNRSNTKYLQKALLHSSRKANGEQEITVFTAYGQLYSALIDANNIEIKVSRMLALWDLAIENGDFPVISSVIAEELLSIKPADHGQEFNARALRSLLLTGEVEKAVLWERVMRRAASQGNIAERLKARSGVARLDAFMLISGANAIARWNSSSFPAWKKASEGDPAQGAKTELLLSILDVFDLPVSAENWQDLILMDLVPDTAKGSYAIERNLTAAASAGRLAETVSLSLLVLGEEGARDASVTTIITVLSALKAVGLEDEARQIAIEALIVKGF